jgi:hypothetical protein
LLLGAGALFWVQREQWEFASQFYRSTFHDDYEFPWGFSNDGTRVYEFVPRQFGNDPNGPMTCEIYEASSGKHLGEMGGWPDNSGIFYDAQWNKFGSGIQVNLDSIESVRSNRTKPLREVYLPPPTAYMTVDHTYLLIYDFERSEIWKRKQFWQLKEAWVAIAFGLVFACSCLFDFRILRQRRRL